MKNLLLIIFVLSLLGNVSAQDAKLTVFNEKPESFVLVVDGLMINTESQTNVSTDLTPGKHLVKVIFMDELNGELTQTIDFKPYQDLSFVLIKSVSVQVVPANSAAQKWDAQEDAEVGYRLTEFSNVIRPHEEEIQQAEIVSRPVDVGNTEANISMVSYSENTTISAEPINAPDPVVVPEVSMGLNLNYNKTPSTTVVVPSSNTTVTKQEITTTNVYVESVPEGQVTTVQAIPVYTPPALVENTGCQQPMTEATFTTARNTVENKSFDETKLNIAKQIAQNNCLKADQVKRMAILFSFEDAKLQFAKYAYAFCYDKQNYFIVNDVFTFDNSISDLNTFIGR